MFPDPLSASQPIHSKRSRLQRTIISLVLLVIVPTAPADTLNQLSDVFTYMPPPRYPVDAWLRTSTGSRRIEGRAVCRVTLNADGTVARVEIADTSGSKILDHASVEALREWRAKPGRAGRYYNIPIKFRGGGSTLGNDNGMGKDGLGIMKSRDR
jgi:TonB family protein